MLGTEDNLIKDEPADAGQYGTVDNVSKDNEISTDNGQKETGQDRPDQVTEKQCFGIIPHAYSTEIRVLFRLAWPIVLACLFSFLPVTVAVIFCGHLGTVELNAIGLAAAMMYATGTITAFGMSTACDTYFSQYYGSINRHKLGVMLQKGLLIMVMTSLPCVAVQINAETILRLMGQSPDACRLVGNYMLIVVPNTVAMFIVLALIKFLQCQNIVIPHLIAGLSWTVLDILFHYILVIVAGLGTDGSAMAHSLSLGLVTLGLALYVCFSGVLDKTWQGWSLECLDEWGGFCKLGLLGIIVLSVDGWCYQIGVVLSGLLSEVDLAAQAVLFELSGTMSLALCGIGMASGIRVGNMLGAGNKTTAVIATRVGIIISVIAGLVAIAMLYAPRHYLPTIFTSDPETINLVSRVLRIAAIRLFFGSMSFTLEGILRGCGRQAIDAAIVFSGHAVSLILGGSLMFKTPLKLFGQWLGFGCGMFLEAVIGLIVVLTTDWDHQVHRALKLTKTIVDDKDQEESAESLCSSDGRDDIPLVTDLSLSQTRSDKLAEAPFSISRAIVVRRLCALLAVVILLLMGVAARLFIVIDDDTSSGHWSSNSTQLNSTNITTMVTTHVRDI